MHDEKTPALTVDAAAKNKHPAKSIFIAISVLSAIGILIGSWAPFNVRPADASATWLSFLGNGWDSNVSRTDVIANFWLGFPLAIGLCGLVRTHSGTIARRISWSLAILLIQSLVSLIAEAGQGWFVNRVPSSVDFIVQILGATVAIIAWQWGGRQIESWTSRAFANPTQKKKWTRLDAILNLIVMGILIWTIMPLDIITTPNELAKEAVKTELVPFTRFGHSPWENIYQWLASFFIAIPIGLWLSRWLARHMTGKLSWPSVILIGVACGVLPELLQFPIDSRVASATDAFFGAAGALAGILGGSLFQSTRFQVAQHRLREMARTPGFWFSLTVIQALIVAAVAWMPFDFTSDTSEVAERLSQLRAMPFSGNGGSDLLYGLTMFRQAILAAGVGIFAGLGLRLLKLRPPYPQLLTIAILTCLLALAGGVEFGQVIVDSRTGDASGTIVRFAGSTIGLVAVMALSKQNGPTE